MMPFIEKNAAALKALEQPVTLDVQDAPLHAVIREIGRQITMPINFDRCPLEDFGIDTKTSLTLRCRNLRASDALARALQDLDLTCMCLGGGLMITTREDAESRLTTALFDVHDLVLTTNGMRDLDSIFEMLMTTIAPCSWDWVGGPGSIDAVCLEKHTVLVVSQTQDVLRRVHSLLDRARQAKKEHCSVLRPRHKEWTAFAKALEKRVAWNFDDMPLEKAVAHIETTLGVDVYLDPPVARRDRR